MNAKGILPILGIGVAAGAAAAMALKPKDQAMIKNKAGQAVKAVGEAMEDISSAMRTNAK